jgi:Mg-chelatase subunit ChlD
MELLSNPSLHLLKNCAEEIKKRNIKVVVIDTESGFFSLGMAKEFAKSCAAKYYKLEDLKPKELVSIIEKQINLF